VDVGVRNRLHKGFGANIYNQGVTIIVQLVGVPVLLYAWGVELYGEWLILFAIPAYLSMSDLGFTLSAANDMTTKVAYNDRVGALVVFQSLSALVHGVIVFALILTTCLLFCTPFSEWLPLHRMSSNEARWVLWFLAAEVFARLADGVNHAGFRANGDYALHLSLRSTTRLLQFSGLWVVALWDLRPVAAAGAFFGVRSLSSIAFRLLLMQRHRWLTFGFAHVRSAELRRLFKPALANIAIPFSQTLNIQGMVLVIGSVLGSVAVVTFSTLRTLTRIAFQLVRSVSNAIEPEIARAYGRQDPGEMNSLFLHGLRASLWLAFAAGICLFVFGELILSLWTKGKVSMDSVLFTWLVISSVSSVLWYGALIVLKAANIHVRAACFLFLSSAIAVGIAAVLLLWTGHLANAGLSLLIIDAVMVYYTLHSTSRFIGVRPVLFLSRAINPFSLIKLVFRSDLNFPKKQNINVGYQKRKYQ